MLSALGQILISCPDTKMARLTPLHLPKSRTQSRLTVINQKNSSQVCWLAPPIPTLRLMLGDYKLEASLGYRVRDLVKKGEGKEGREEGNKKIL